MLPILLFVLFVQLTIQLNNLIKLDIFIFNDGLNIIRNPYIIIKLKYCNAYTAIIIQLTNSAVGDTYY